MMTEEQRLAEVVDIVASALGKRERTMVEIVRVSKNDYRIFLAVRIGQVAMLRTDSGVNLDTLEDEEEKEVAWGMEIAAIFTSACRLVGAMSDREVFGIGRAENEDVWYLLKIPVFETQDDARVMAKADLPEGKEVAEIGVLPKSDDIEGWKKVILRTGKKIFGYW